MPFWSGFPWPAVALLMHVVTGASPDIEGGRPRVFQPQGWLPPLHECPESCEELFGKLEANSAAEGKKAQRVEIQERGGELLVSPSLLRRFFLRTHATCGLTICI